MKSTIKKLLDRLGILRYLLMFKRYLRMLRTTWLCSRFPNGGFSNCNGAKVFVNYYDDNYAWYDGDSDYLKHEIAAFKTLFRYRAPRSIIDIGAHWGFYPAILEYESTIEPLGIASIVCIEPDARNILNLRKTAAQISAFKVVIVEKAVSDSDGEVDLYVGDDQSCPHLHRTESDISIGLVMSKTLPSILEEIDMIDQEITHIKVDIDGYEPAFFKGALEFLKRNRPLLLVEFWATGIEAAQFNIEEYWQLLHSMYEVSEVDYPLSEPKILNLDDLSYLRNKTRNAITNLLLVPK